MKPLRRTVRRALVALLGLRLALLFFQACGAAIPVPVLRAVEATTLAPAVACALFLGADYRRHRRVPLPPRKATAAAVREMVPLVLRRLAVHEVQLFTSFVRWITRFPPHGVGQGDTAVRYAAAQAFLIYGFFFVSVVETVALAVIIPWPAVSGVVLVVDLWGVYFVIALQAACAVRPHVVLADGSLRLRYGVLMEISVPAKQIVRARVERRCPDGRGFPAKLQPDGSLDMAVGGQTTVTVTLTAPVRFLRPLGREAAARVLRFYADDPAAAVTALCQAGRKKAVISGNPPGGGS